MRVEIAEYAAVDVVPITSVKPYTDIIPDYWYLCEHGDGWMIRYVEVISGEESATRVKEKLEEYQAWSKRPEIQRYLNDMYRKLRATNPLPEFELHCVVESRSFKRSDATKERSMMMQAFNVDPAMQMRVWTTTKDRLESAWTEGQTINAPIWYRAADFRGLPRQKYEQQKLGTRTAYVDRLMRQVDPHPLFAG